MSTATKFATANGSAEPDAKTDHWTTYLILNKSKNDRLFACLRYTAQRALADKKLPDDICELTNGNMAEILAFLALDIAEDPGNWGSLIALDFLLEAGIPIDICAIDALETALHRVGVITRTFNASGPVVTKDAAALLLSKGASIDARNKYGETPLARILCIAESRVPLINFFIDQGANVNNVDVDGDTPLSTLVIHFPCTTDEEDTAPRLDVLDIVARFVKHPLFDKSLKGNSRKPIAHLEGRIRDPARFRIMNLFYRAAHNMIKVSFLEAQNGSLSEQNRSLSEQNAALKRQLGAVGQEPDPAGHTTPRGP